MPPELMNSDKLPFSQLPQHKHLLGKRGEEAAVFFLQKHHYRILDRNFCIRGGEVDIIARTGDVIVFVEVKTRTSSAFGGPVAAITPKKLRDIVKTAEFYLSTHPNLPYSFRVDVISVLMSNSGSVVSLDHILNATFS